jgi:hypothetical protein
VPAPILQLRPIHFYLPNDEIADSLIEQAALKMKLPLGLDAYNLYINNERIRPEKLVSDFAADATVDNPAIIRNAKGILDWY